AASRAAVAPAGGCGPAASSALLQATQSLPRRRSGLLASRNRPSECSVSDHRPAPVVALPPNPSAPWASPPSDGVWASPDGTAESSLSSPAFAGQAVPDRSFACCCSPPHLVATQLHSASGWSRPTWGGLPLS